MSTVTSKDGTQIAYDKIGSGPAVILIDGALGYRSFGSMPRLAEMLSPKFTVYTYDRRGRGESGDGKPFALEREVEDLDALIQAAGGSAYLFGSSSGACLAMETAARLGSKVKRLAMWEPPYDDDETAKEKWKQYRKNLAQAIATDRRGDAVVLFMQLVGTPAEAIEGMRQAPMWPMFEAVAPTLAFDAAAMGDDRSTQVQRAAQVSAQTLVLNGTVLAFMLPTAQKLAKAMPHARQRTLEGQSHDVNMDVLAPVLLEFFSS